MVPHNSLNNDASINQHSTASQHSLTGIDAKQPGRNAQALPASNKSKKCIPIPVVLYNGVQRFILARSAAEEMTDKRTS